MCGLSTGVLTTVPWARQLSGATSESPVLTGGNGCLRLRQQSSLARGCEGRLRPLWQSAPASPTPVLYAHFENKDSLFRETVERSIDKRLRALEANLAEVTAHSVIECVESMAEATVAVCVSGAANAVLTNWALLETPDYTTDLLRKEVGNVCLLWEHRLAERFPGSRSRGVISMHLVPYAVHACLAYGFWLAAFRHSPASAAPLVRQFAGGIALAASTLISSEL